MRREGTAGASFREGIMEVAFEQRTKQVRDLSRLRRDPYVTRKQYRSNPVLTESRRILLKLGGNTDKYIRPKSAKTGLGHFII